MILEFLSIVKGICYVDHVWDLREKSQFSLSSKLQRLRSSRGQCAQRFRKVNIRIGWAQTWEWLYDEKINKQQTSQSVKSNYSPYSPVIRTKSELYSISELNWIRGPFIINKTSLYWNIILIGNIWKQADHSYARFLWDMNRCMQ